MARAGRHGAEGVRAARREGVEAGGQQEDEQRPVVRLRPEARSPCQRQQAPHEVPAAGRCSGPPPAAPRPLPTPGTPSGRRSPGGQEVSPDVGRLVGHLEGAEDAVPGRAAGAAIARQDAVLPEHLCGAGWGTRSGGATGPAPFSPRQTSASGFEESGLEVTPAPKPSQLRAAPYRVPNTQRAEEKARRQWKGDQRGGVRWGGVGGRRDSGWTSILGSGEGSPAGSLDSRGMPAGRRPPHPRPAGQRGKPGDGELVGQAPHPRDLVDSEELGQLETEHGGRAPPRRDLETKRGVRASGVCPHPGPLLTPGRPGLATGSRSALCPQVRAGAGVHRHTTCPPSPPGAFGSRVRGAAQFQPGTDSAGRSPARRQPGVSSPKPRTRVPSPQFLSLRKPESGRSVPRASAHPPPRPRTPPGPRSRAEHRNCARPELGERPDGRGSRNESGRAWLFSEDYTCAPGVPDPPEPRTPQLQTCALPPGGCGSAAPPASPRHIPWHHWRGWASRRVELPRGRERRTLPLPQPKQRGYNTAPPRPSSCLPRRRSGCVPVRGSLRASPLAGPGPPLPPGSASDLGAGDPAGGRQTQSLVPVAWLLDEASPGPVAPPRSGMGVI